MKKLDESEIIKIFQKGLGNKKFVSEDVETFSFGKSKIIVKVDTLVSSTDIPSKMSLFDAVRKSIVACISDFAAKGVKPEFGIISINLPRSISRCKIKDISKGLSATAKEFSIKFLGGDTNEGQEIVFHVCMFGKSDRIIPRKGAKNGDLIFVTGPFGYTAAGLKILLHGKKSSKEFTRKAITTVFKPKPRLKFGLEARKYISSAMDSSDGLSTTLNEMSKQSNQKFVIENIPTCDDVYEFAKNNKIDPIEIIFHGGEEYELVFTVSKRSKSKILEIASHLNIPIVQIGEVAKGRGVYVKNNSKLLRLKDFGWHHFKNHSPE